MPDPRVLAVRDLLEATAADPGLDAAGRVRAIRTLRMDIESLMGVADRFIGDNELHREREAAAMARDRVVARENADIREELIRREMATAAELDEAGVWSHEELDRREAEGLPLLEARSLKGKAFGLAANFDEQKVKRDKGKFARVAVAATPKDRGAARGKVNVDAVAKLNAEKAQPAPTTNGQGSPPAMTPGRAAARPASTPATKPIPGRAPRGKPRPTKGADAYEADDDGVHDVGSDVSAAADLLAQGKKVRLSQPREVSILLDELAQRVQAAKAAGEKAPNFNLCDVSVPGTNLFCAESKGVPRIKMPQLGGTPLPGSKAAAKAEPDGNVDLTGDFRAWLEDSKVRITDETELASHMKATQMELNGAKVAGMAGVLDRGEVLGGDPRIFISKDGYVVDGHHRWAAHVGHDLQDGTIGDVEMPVARVDMDIIELIEAANRYSKEQGIPQAGVEAMSGKDALAAAEPAPPASPGTGPKAPAVDPQRKAEVDSAIQSMYEPAETEPATQNFADFDEMYQTALSENDALTTLLTEELPDLLGATVPSFDEALDTAANNPGQTQILMGPPKKEKRSREKVAANYGGDHNELKDVIRATILVGNLEELPQTLAALRERARAQGWELRGAQDKITDGPPPPHVKGPTNAGYSDTKLFLVSPKGVTAELQLNSNSMFIAKEGEGHKLYERQRSLEAAIKRRYRYNDSLAQLQADPDGPLPENSDLYFNTDEAALKAKYGTGDKKDPLEVKEVPLSRITPTRARSGGIERARPLMRDAALGEGERRDPITLIDQGDGTYRVHDGNSTFAIAEGEDWKGIVAMVVPDEEHAARIEAKMKESKGQPTPPASPGTTRDTLRQAPEGRDVNGPTADELTELTELKEKQKALYGKAAASGYGG